MRRRRPKDAEDLPFCHVEDRKWTFEATLCKEQTRQFQKICPSSWDFPHFTPGKHPKNMFYIRCFWESRNHENNLWASPWHGNIYLWSGLNLCLKVQQDVVEGLPWLADDLESFESLMLIHLCAYLSIIRMLCTLYMSLILYSWSHLYYIYIIYMHITHVVACPVMLCRVVWCTLTY